MEAVEYSDKDLQKEDEANEFAIKWTLSKEEEQQILQQVLLQKTIKEEEIIAFAQKFNTHPAIIIGRLQHDKIIPYSMGRSFFEVIDFDNQ